MSNLKTEPLVSVIITTCDRPELFKKALQSVLDQTYKHLEIIVVDNGINEAVDQQDLAKYKAINPNIKLLRYMTPLGGSKARNIGIKEASGYYLAFLDDDDVWLPKKLAEQINALKTNGQCSIITCNYYNNYENGPITLVEISANHSDKGKNGILLSNIVGGCSAPLLKTHELRALGGFDESLKSFQDWDMWLRIIYNFGPHYCLKAPLVSLNISKTGRISTNLKNRLHGQFRFLSKHKSIMPRSVQMFHALRMFQMVLQQNELTSRMSKPVGKVLRAFSERISGKSYSFIEKSTNTKTNDNNK
jgi:glycosyltransferase involved in cell wall biosynthesis